MLADPKATAKRLDELRLLIEQSKKARAKLEADRAVHDRSVAAAEAEMIAKEQALRRREVDLAGREGVLRVVPSVGSAGSLSRAIHSLPPFGAALPDAGIGALPIVGESVVLAIGYHAGARLRLRIGLGCRSARSGWIARGRAGGRDVGHDALALRSVPPG